MVASPIVPYKLYVVPLVALLDAVDADGVPVRRVAGVTPGEVTEKIQHPNTAPESPIPRRQPGGSSQWSRSSALTCRSRAWGNWCSWRSCRGTALGSPPSRWRPGCSGSYCLTAETREERSQPPTPSAQSSHRLHNHTVYWENLNKLVKKSLFLQAQCVKLGLIYDFYRSH